MSRKATRQDKPECQLTGSDGNVFMIIGKVSVTLKRAGMSDEASEFKSKATKCKSYEDVLALCEDYVDVC